eukprot:scaffold2643_cov117-Isochrysis_galbana.AAC.13
MNLPPVGVWAWTYYSTANAGTGYYAVAVRGTQHARCALCAVCAREEHPVAHGASKNGFEKHMQMKAERSARTTALPRARAHKGIKTKLRERVEGNNGAPTAPAGAGGGRHGRGKMLEASPR